MTKPLTKSQALTTYKTICKHLGQQTHPQVVEQGGGTWPTDRPVLCRNWEGRGHYAVVLEGQYDWPFDVTEAAHAGKLTLPAEVFAEPSTGYALSLYPA